CLPFCRTHIHILSIKFSIFFFQAEDGIRDGHVTGVQTCALPICLSNTGAHEYKLLYQELDRVRKLVGNGAHFSAWTAPQPGQNRSEERRVGKECRSRWSPYY